MPDLVEEKPWLKAALTPKSKKETKVTFEEKEEAPLRVTHANPSLAFNSRLKLSVVYNSEEYIAAMKAGQRVGKDFQIHPNAHCSFTMSGEICPDVRKCDGVHLFRCNKEVAGEECIFRNCSFLHAEDLPTEDDSHMFHLTMDRYCEVTGKRRRA